MGPNYAKKRVLLRRAITKVPVWLVALDWENDTLTVSERLISRHHGGPIEAPLPLKPLNTIIVSVIFEGFQCLNWASMMPKFPLCIECSVSLG